MAVSKVKVSQLPKATTTTGLVVLGVASNNQSVQADMELLRGNTGASAFDLWLKQPGNADKTYDDYLAYNKQPATDAAASVKAVEDAVKQAEAMRVIVEQARVDAEAARVREEERRVAAENSRKTVEESRVTAEQGRVTAESGRVTEEGKRVNAEQERAGAETLRAEAETTREQNETTRQQQESARQTNTGKAIRDAEAATTRATGAAEVSEELNSHQPIQQIGAGGVLTWWVWDLSQEGYIDTTLPARGPEGKGPVVLSNGNFGNWDEEIQDYIDSGVLATATVDLDNVPVVFTEAAARTTLNSGETVPTIFGKLKKWFTDFGALAWKSVVDYTTEIVNAPTKLSQFLNDRNYRTGDEVNASIATHNTDGTAHSDIRTGLATINGKIPAAASPTNQLADKDFVNSSIANMAANYVTFDAAGNAFATKAALLAAEVFYHGGFEYTPSEHDYVTVLADESHDNECWRYTHTGTTWSAQYRVNEAPMTQAQLNALNSGITSAKVASYDNLLEYPKHKTVTLTPSNWQLFEGYYRAAVSDPDLVTGVAVVAYTDTIVGLRPVLMFASGVMYVCADVKPTANVVLSYDILGKGASASCGVVVSRELTEAQRKMLDFMSASKTVSSLANLVLDSQIIYVPISSNQSISVSSHVVEGQPAHLLVYNTGTTARTITIPTTGSYVSMSGASKTLPASGYLEISIIYDAAISKYRIVVLEGE